jgi:DNA-binding response OmpR family regulator
MDSSFYDVASILICDPVVENRSSTCSVLYAQGCRNMETVGSLRDFAHALEKNPPDIALVEASHVVPDLCQLIRNIRAGDPRYNPFTLIIVTSWQTDAQLAAQISNAGADSLLSRPFSAAQLRERIEAHVMRKRRFVVTAHYTGPERRADPTRESGVLAIEAPNTIAIKEELWAHREEMVRRLNAEIARGRVKLAAARARFNQTALSG